MRPWDRISIDFKGPLSGKHKYLLTVVDKFSRFPFAFPCSNMTTETFIQCLSELLYSFGYPLNVHSDQGASFMRKELKRYLKEHRIASSKIRPYHPIGNARCERINQSISRTVKLFLRQSYIKPYTLCVLTYALPPMPLPINEKINRFLGFNGRSMSGRALPSFLIQPGPVLLRRFVRSKSSPWVKKSNF